MAAAIRAAWADAAALGAYTGIQHVCVCVCWWASASLSLCALLLLIPPSCLPYFLHCFQLQVAEGLNDTAENLMAAIASDEQEVSPSTLYATACVLEGAPFINGSPQNTFVPGLIEMAVENNVLIGGDDFKSGQVGRTGRKK